MGVEHLLNVPFFKTTYTVQNLQISNDCSRCGGDYFTSRFPLAYLLIAKAGDMIGNDLLLLTQLRYIGIAEEQK